jgi:exonuclease V gamma subunit
MTRENPKLIQALKDGKAPLEYLPWGSLQEVAWVMKSGADKYGRFNWRIDKIRASTYVAAIARHALLEWAQGQDEDKDSGRHTLAHVVACCLIVMDAQAQDTLIDDRLECESKAVKLEGSGGF